MIPQTRAQVSAQEMLIRNGIQNYEKITILKNKVKSMLQTAEKENSQTIENFNAAILTVILFYSLNFIAARNRAPQGTPERRQKNACWHLLWPVQNEQLEEPVHQEPKPNKT